MNAYSFIFRYQEKHIWQINNFCIFKNCNL